MTQLLLLLWAIQSSEPFWELMDFALPTSIPFLDWWTWHNFIWDLLDKHLSQMLHIIASGSFFSSLMLLSPYLFVLLGFPAYIWSPILPCSSPIKTQKPFSVFYEQCPTTIYLTGKENREEEKLIQLSAKEEVDVFACSSHLIPLPLLVSIYLDLEFLYSLYWNGCTILFSIMKIHEINDKKYYSWLFGFNIIYESECLAID